MVLCILAVLEPVSSWSGESGCLELLKARCLRCHYETRICYRVQKKKSRWFWKRTVKAMRAQGAQLTDQEQRTLVGCLSRPDAHIVAFCTQGK